MCTLDNRYDSKWLPTIFDRAPKAVKDSSGSQWLQHPRQRPGSQVCNSRSSSKVRYRICKQYHVFIFYHRLFLVPKPGNRWCPVIDLSDLNQYLDTKVQGGDPGINPGFPSPRGVGLLDRPAGCIPARTDSGNSCTTGRFFSSPVSPLG